MRAETKFLKMYYKLPERARRELLIWKCDKDANKSFALSIVALEVRNNTVLGKEFLKLLGYENDATKKVN